VDGTLPAPWGMRNKDVSCVNYHLVISAYAFSSKARTIKKHAIFDVFIGGFSPPRVCEEKIGHSGEGTPERPMENERLANFKIFSVVENVFVLLRRRLLKTVQI
jgi:hypothetical protein